MRSLQRLRHTLPPSEEDLTQIEQTESRLIARKERRARRRRSRLLIPAVVFVLVACGVWFILLQLRFVADGLVQSLPVVATAPGPVRVVEVYCKAGQPCYRGDPLVRIEALGEQPERRALEQVVEQRRLRLALVEAGASVDSFDLTRRRDLVDEAEREATMAATAQVVAGARTESLVQSKAATALSLENERLEANGRVTALRERLTEAEALLSGAEAERREALDAAERSRALYAEGVTSRAELVARETELEAAVSNLAALDADARKFKAELESAREIESSTGLHNEAALTELDARIDISRREESAARIRTELWQDIASRRQRLLPAAEEEGIDLVELEQRLLRAELKEAEAKLAQLDLSIGNMLVRAESDGIVDQIHVAVGAAVSEDAPLISYYNPTTQWVVAYVPPKATEDLRPGQLCALVLENSDEVIEAVVVALGSTWVHCPPELPMQRNEAADLRLPVRIECRDGAKVAHLGPNMRLKIRFRDEVADTPRVRVRHQRPY